MSGLLRRLVEQHAGNAPPAIRPLASIPHVAPPELAAEDGSLLAGAMRERLESQPLEPAPRADGASPAAARPSAPVQGERVSPGAPTPLLGARSASPYAAGSEPDAEAIGEASRGGAPLPDFANGDSVEGFQESERPTGTARAADDLSRGATPARGPAADALAETPATEASNASAREVRAPGSDRAAHAAQAGATSRPPAVGSRVAAPVLPERLLERSAPDSNAGRGPTPGAEGASRRAVAAREPELHVSIGSIEVTAVHAPAPAEKPKRERRGPMPLEEYLARREGRHA